MIIVSPSRACNQDRKGSDQARGSVPSHPPPKPTVASSLTSTYNLCLSGCLTHSLTHPLSLRPSVRPSVRPPARPPARPSVRAPHSPPSLSLFLSLSLDQHPEMRPFMAAVTLPNARGRVCRRLHRPGRPARAVIVRRPPLSTPSSPRGTPRHPSPPRAAGARRVEVRRRGLGRAPRRCRRQLAVDAAGAFFAVERAEGGGVECDGFASIAIGRAGRYSRGNRMIQRSSGARGGRRIARYIAGGSAAVLNIRGSCGERMPVRLIPTR